MVKATNSEKLLSLEAVEDDDDTVEGSGKSSKETPSGVCRGKQCLESSSVLIACAFREASLHTGAALILPVGTPIELMSSRTSAIGRVVVGDFTAGLLMESNMLAKKKTVTMATASCFCVWISLLVSYRQKPCTSVFLTGKTGRRKMYLAYVKKPGELALTQWD